MRSPPDDALRHLAVTEAERLRDYGSLRLPRDMPATGDWWV
jgi:hypothetical protein